MTRWTTPTITIAVDGVNLSEMGDIELSLRQDNILLNKKLSLNEMELLEDDNAIRVKLTQQESGDFQARPVKLQLRLKTNDTSDPTVLASDILIKNMKEILDESEL